jgi:hypothetical protein
VRNSRLLHSFFKRVLSKPSHVVQHVRDSMLIASAPTERSLSALHLTQSASSKNVVHDTLVAQLAILTTQMKFIVYSVAAMVASSSHPSSAGDHRHPTICPYCDMRCHIKAVCYQRRLDIKCDALAVACTETVVAAALAPPAPQIAGALWELPACLSHALFLECELDACFVSANGWFLVCIIASNHVSACVPRFRLFNDVEHSAEKDDCAITMMQTRTDAGFDNVVVPPPHAASPTAHDVFNLLCRAPLPQDLL